jgi:hypothetical protein
MNFPDEPPIGNLIAYEYLWHSQRGAREDGVKTYPVALIFAKRGKHLCLRGGDFTQASLCDRTCDRSSSKVETPSWLGRGAIMDLHGPGERRGLVLICDLRTDCLAFREREAHASSGHSRKTGSPVSRSKSSKA